MRAGETVFVTGFPRLIAKLVVRETLAVDPSRRIVMLVRDRFVADAEAFVLGLGGHVRVELLEGDAAKIDLGLSGAEFRALATDVDVIQHHAQMAYEGTDARSAEALNVQGAREVLGLARAAHHLRRLVHQSSAMVSGDRRGTVRERELECGQSFATPIDETRFRAERFFHHAQPSLPITVLRPAHLVGDSRTGEIDRLDGPYLLVTLLLNAPREFALPLPGRGDVPLHFVPVDYVARAAVALADDPRAVGRTVHLVDPSPPTVKHVYGTFAAKLGRKAPRGFVPVNLARTLLRTPGLERFVQSPRAFLDRLAIPVTYEHAAADELLAPKGVRVPGFDSYAGVLVDHVRDRNEARKARRAEPSSAEVEDPLA